MSYLRIGIAPVLVAWWVQAAFAGSYVDVVDCNMSTGCAQGEPATTPSQCQDPNPPCPVPPFAITHPFGYNDTQTVVEVKICLDAGSTDLESALLWSIDLWATLETVEGNCHNCALWEDGPRPAGTFYAATAMAHELGHCAMGLDHVDRFWDADNDGTFEATSFTRSVNVANAAGAIDDGADDVRGSNDDFHTAPGGGAADSTSWFRIADNDPFVIDTTTIDNDTYSRSLSNLPGDSTWGASANRGVAEALDYGSGSQSVMYARGTSDMFYWGLSADDVNMVRMGMSGADLDHGTPDDYTIDLKYVGDCSNPHHIKVSLLSFGSATVLGRCRKKIDYSYSQNPLLAKHFSIVRHDPSLPVEVELNSDISWDFDVPAIFRDGFESGNTSSWAAVSP